MSVKRELEIARELLIKRLEETEDALSVPLGTRAGNEYLEKKITYTKEAIRLMGDIILANEGEV